ncbi:MAG: hypothetical protein GY824_23175, partial [Delftia sp.]|nr:hypothetical protein [Delftia sp.]
LSLATGSRAATQSPFTGNIISPTIGDELRGSVQIVGVATHPEFAKYDIYALTGRAEDDWIAVVTAVGQNVESPAQLAVWDTTQIPDGEYVLLLRVWKQDEGLQDFLFSPYFVVNSRPVDTPTPVASPTPQVILPTVPPQTPTVLIEQPPTATPRPTFTPGGPTTPTPTDEPSPLSELNTVGWWNSFCRGAWMVAALFALWGVAWIIRQGVRWGLKYQRKKGLFPRR